VRQTLWFISQNSAPGSSVAMDFAGTALIEMLHDFPEMPQHRFTTAWGEPWIFGVPDTREREFFRECGLELREMLSFFGREAAERYLKRKGGGTLGQVRGGPPRGAPLTVAKMVWRFFRRRSQWYGLAELVVP